MLALLCGVGMVAFAQQQYYYYYYGNQLACPPGATFVTSGTIPCNCSFTYPAGTCCMNCESPYSVCNKVIVPVPAPGGGWVLVLTQMWCSLS